MARTHLIYPGSMYTACCGQDPLDLHATSKITGTAGRATCDGDGAATQPRDSATQPRDSTPQFQTAAVEEPAVRLDQILGVRRKRGGRRG